MNATKNGLIFGMTMLRVHVWACEAPFAGSDWLISFLDLPPDAGFRVMRARAMPIVRTTNPMRCFCPTNMCSAAERTAERFAFALAICSGIGRRGGFFWWMLLINMPLARNASFFFER